MTAKSRKTLFLVDAMGYIFRAYYAPMGERFEHKGIPTKVPYIFATMMRRLIEGQKPDYLGVVYDTPQPTFRDKLFAEYKAQRAPMPADLFIQVPFVPSSCEAMRLPTPELAGYEADNVIATLARQSVQRSFNISPVT